MVHFVGAGPGAVDLITVRGMELIKKTDVIIYAGSLVNPQLLDEFKVGIKLDFKDYEETREKVVKFINNFKTDYPQYLSEINRAAEVYSFENVVKGLLKYKAV